MKSRVKLAMKIGHEWQYVETDCFVTQTEGLVINRRLDNDTLQPMEQWVVTHARSGAMVALFDGPEQAMYFANVALPQAMPSIDWTLPGEEVVKQRNTEYPDVAVWDLGSKKYRVVPMDDPACKEMLSA